MNSLLSTVGDELFGALDNSQNTVQLASPYLTTRVANELASRAQASAAEWTVITALNAQAMRSGYQSPSGLRALLESGVQVRHLPGLHAKVYLVDGQFGLVGSGNLTSTGLGLDGRGNVELAAQLDGQVLEEAAAKFAEWSGASDPVDATVIAEFEKAAAALPAEAVTPNPELTPTAEAGEVLLQLQLDAQARPDRLWVKAQSGEARPDVWEHDAWFASGGKGKPTFAPGDLVLIYAKDARACYVVLEITSRTTYDPDFMAAQGVPEGHPEQWPWLSHTKTRLIAPENRYVKLSEIDVSPQGLQNGRTRIELSDFLLATQLMSAD